MERGWVPDTPRSWIDPDQKTWPVVTKSEQLAMVRHFRHTLALWLWQEAALQHPMRKGCEEGIDLHVARKLLNTYRKANKPDEAGMLETILVGSVWTEDRRYRAGYRTDPMCRLCGQEADTEMHRYWECPALQRRFKEDEPIKWSQYMAEGALASWQSCPIFFSRGCVPKKWTRRKPIPAMPTTFIMGASTRYNRDCQPRPVGTFLADCGPCPWPVHSEGHVARG